MKRFINILIVIAVIGCFIASFSLADQLQKLEESGAGLSSENVEQGPYFTVHDSEGNETKYSLNENTTFTITTSLGTNEVVVEDGTVRVNSADCPNQTCVNTGRVSEAGKQIICLPHELYIEVHDAQSSDVDTSSK